MPELAGLGTSLVLIVAVLLWVAYLVPVWTRRREYLATERNAIRLQQTLRIMAESAESPEEVRIEADARTIAVQQRAVAKEARLKQAMEHAKAVARARELDEQIKAVEREVRAAVRTTVSRAQRLRRTRLACFALVLLAVAAVVAGALLPGLGMLLVAGGAALVLGLAGLVAVNASAARVRSVAAATAPSVRTLVEAREVAAEAVAAEARVAEQVVARVQRTEELLRSRSWSPAQVPEQRAGTAQRTSAGQRASTAPSLSGAPRAVAEQRVAAQPGDELLQRARRRLAEDRRAISGPLARVSPLEPSFEELVTGEVPQTDVERRLAPTAPAVPIRRIELDEAVDAAEALDVVRAEVAEQPAAPAAEAAPARRATASGSRFAAMGVVEEDLAGVDVHEAFLRRRVG